jgi:hypothetical protein
LFKINRTKIKSPKLSLSTIISFLSLEVIIGMYVENSKPDNRQIFYEFLKVPERILGIKNHQEAKTQSL